MLDFNGVEPAKPNEAIPDGTFAKAIMTIRPGGVDGDSPIDRGLLTASRAEGSDVIQLDCEFTILEGLFARRKFWRKLVLSGGKVDEQGVSIGWKITKSALRAILNSAHGLDPKDESPAAQAKRRINGFYDLNNLVFVAKVQTDSEGRSELDAAITRDRPEWAKVLAGEHVPPKPSAKRRSANKPAGSQAAGAQQPAWQQSGPAAGPAWGGPPNPAPQADAQAQAARPPTQPAPNPPAQPAAAPGVAAWQPPAAVQRRAGPAWLNE